MVVCFLMIPMLIGLLTLLLLDILIALSVWLAVAGYVISTLLWETCVPLIKR